MRKFIAEREEKEDGFTLIELMVVVLIMGILMAIAIPTFLSTTNGANKSAATSNLTNSLTNAKSYYDSNSEDFTDPASLVSSLNSSEPSFNFTTGAAVNSTSNAVSVWTNGTAATTGSTPTAATAGTEVVLAAQAKGTNTCYYIDDVEQTVSSSPSGLTAPGVYYGSAAGTSAGCTAGGTITTSAPAASTSTTAGHWSTSQAIGWGA